MSKKDIVSLSQDEVKAVSGGESVDYIVNFVGIFLLVNFLVKKEKRGPIFFKQLGRASVSLAIMSGFRKGFDLAGDVVERLVLYLYERVELGFSGESNGDDYL